MQRAYPPLPIAGALLPRMLFATFVQGIAVQYILIYRSREQSVDKLTSTLTSYRDVRM